MNTATEKTAKPAEQAADENSLLSIVNQAESVNETQAPGSASAAQSEPAIDDATLGISQMLVGFMAQGAMVAYPCLSFDNATKEQGAAVLAPVLAKHNIQNAFFEKWKEEFAAGMFFGGLVFASWVKIQEWKLAQAKEVKSDAEA